MNNNFKNFAKKTFFVSLPILVFFVVIDTIAISFGELTSVKTVVDSQDKDILYGRKVVDQELRKYKYELYNKRGSDILAIGSSRILSIREEFFLPYYSFTNLGSIAHNIGDVEDLVYRLATSSSPKYVFVCLDYYWFGSKRSQKSALTSDLEIWDVSIDWRAHIFASRYVANLLLRDFGSIREYFSFDNKYRRSYGFQGREGNGYRMDGSYLYSNFLRELRKNNVYQDREQPSIIERIRNGSGSYAFDSVFDSGRLLILDKILKELKQKNYYVIGLDLPYSSEVYNELLNNPRHNKLFAEYQEKIPTVFSENDFMYFDYADLKELNLNDLYMFDGVHPTETASASIVIDILKNLDTYGFRDRGSIINHLKNTIHSVKTTTFELDNEILAL